MPSPSPDPTKTPRRGSSEVASPESFGLRHLRRFSSYLVGRGWADALAAALTGLGGVLGNVLILLPYLLLLAMLAVAQLRLVGTSVSIAGAVVLLGVALLTALLYAIAQARRRAMARPWADRERFGRRMALLGGIALAVALWMVQPPLLQLLRDMSRTLSWQGMAAAITGGGVAAGILSAGRLVLATPLLRRPAIAALLLLVALALLWLLFAALGLALLGIEQRIGFVSMIVASVGLAVLLFVIGRMLPANFGSLHGFYRDRLSKAYFFKPHKPGTPSLDQFDDCQLSGLDVGHLPYPLINACLNVSDASSRQEDLTREYTRPGRRGTFFLFSRNAVGNDTLGYVSATRFEADNVLDGSLATAMAISGAAFGANMGYKTNPAAVLLLTLLNVRTGRWVKFPPTNSSKPLLQRLLGDYAYLTLAREAIARFDGASGDLLLSDGGHVDNLGLYQLLQRRCSLIIACDAEADPAYAFEGLADAVRLAKIDLNVTVEIDYAHLAAIRDGKRHFAVGRVRYPDAPDGRLIYLKSSLTHEALRDVSLLHYHRSNSAFPHETTADQFFSEQQFEAYRSLGYCACSRTFEGPAAG